MRYSIFIFLFFLGLILTTGCDRPEAIKASGVTIKVGVIGPFSGPDRALGDDGLRGIRTVMHMQPFLGNGDRVELVIEDDKNDPGLSVNALKKLTTKDKVSAILLLSSSASALAVNELADSYQVPVLVLLATHPDIAKDKAFVSQLIFDNTFQGSVAALFVRDELLIDTVAVFYNKESAYSTSLAYEFIRKFGAIGGEITANIDIPIKADANDLKNIMEMQGP
jgi:branched-chain amino acid transport system substrate-binding protein